MQYVNDDMDELFRRAAENYPLDTNGSDWNKIVAGLQGQEEADTPAKRTNRSRFLWLLLLLPIGLVCNYYQNHVGDNDVNKMNSGQSNALPSVTEQKSNTTINDVTGAPGSNGETLPASGQSPATSLPGVPGDNSINNDIANTNSASIQMAASQKNRKGNAAGAQQKYFAVKTNAALPVEEVTSMTGGITSDLTFANNTAFTGFIHPQYFPGSWNYNAPGAQFKPVSKESVNQNNTAIKQKRFYVGVMGGIDITTIHFQKLTQNGYDYGGLLGYKIGSRWSVEAAAFMDKKYYYTDGKYYEKGNIYLPPNTSITDINGNCRMWDLSLGGTYTLAQKQKSSWFAAAGMSSYLMKKESYDYTYYYAGSGYSAVHNKEYENASKNYFSIVNLSAGYTRRLGKNADLRVEPYLKVPLNGVGVGNLPLFSGGIHLGVTSKLF